jgi:hypothetical protein
VLQTTSAKLLSTNDIEVIFAVGVPVVLVVLAISTVPFVTLLGAVNVTALAVAEFP